MTPLKKSSFSSTVFLDMCAFPTKISLDFCAQYFIKMSFSSYDCHKRPVSYIPQSLTNYNYQYLYFIGVIFSINSWFYDFNQFWTSMFSIRFFGISSYCTFLVIIYKLTKFLPFLNKISTLIKNSCISKKEEKIFEKILLQRSHF